MKKHGLILIIFLLVSSTLLCADCVLKLNDIADIDWRESSSGYNPYDSSAWSQTVSFQVSNDGSSNCDYFVTASKGDNQSPQYDRKARHTITGESLSYQLYKTNIMDQKILRAVPDLYGNDSVIDGKVRKNKFQRQQYYVFIPHSQIVAPGEYSDDFETTLINGTWTNTPAPEDSVETKQVRLRIQVPELMVMETGSGGGSVNIDFNEPEPGESQQFFILVKSNSSYTLYAQSMNGQILAHENPIVETALPYNFKLNSKKISLPKGSDKVIASSKKPTSSEGEFYPINVELDQFDPLVAGRYSETIQVTLVGN